MQTHGRINTKHAAAAQILANCAAFCFAIRKELKLLPNRIRNVQINFRVSQEEKEQIEKKMEMAGLINREAYLRKMVMDGFILKPDLRDKACLETKRWKIV